MRTKNDTTDTTKPTQDQRRQEATRMRMLDAMKRIRRAAELAESDNLEWNQELNQLLEMAHDMIDRAVRKIGKV